MRAITKKRISGALDIYLGIVVGIIVVIVLYALTI